MERRVLERIARNFRQWPVCLSVYNFFFFWVRNYFIGHFHCIKAILSRLYGEEHVYFVIKTFCPKCMGVDNRILRPKQGVKICGVISCCNYGDRNF